MRNDINLKNTFISNWLIHVVVFQQWRKVSPDATNSEHVHRITRGKNRNLTLALAAVLTQKVLQTLDKMPNNKNTPGTVCVRASECVYVWSDMSRGAISEKSSSHV